MTRTALRIAAWNALLVISGLLLIALAGEAYFRLKKPFIETSIPFRFVDGVGVIREPNAEVIYANWHSDNFVVSHTNSQGFLDREPVSPERAAAGCHIAFIGDSLVEAAEVPIADKFQARLEKMAARELPRLDITTSAYGIRATGQINQLPFYDEYARRLNTKLVILVFYVNDFANNITAAQALNYGADPDRMPFMSAHRDANGTLKLRPPDPEYERFLLPRPPDHRWHNNAWRRLVGVSRLAKWLEIERLRWLVYSDRARYSRAWANIIAERPCCEWLRSSQIVAKFTAIGSAFKEERLPPALEEALQYTEFGIDQFNQRADRDGANLLIMTATKDMGTPGDPQFDRISAIAEARGIPIISDYDYIVRQGRNEWEGLDSTSHWNATGHQWVAEAILEWLKQNQDVCD